MDDPNLTADEPIDGDSLDVALAAAFESSSNRGVTESVLATFHHTYGVLRPVLLHEADGDSAHVVRTHTDAMPDLNETGSRYQLSGELARGGMGAVLRGRDVDLGRDLAVKVLLDKHAGRPGVVRRFLEEAQVGAQLQHPGIVPVYDIGRFGDRPFFTMKLVKGRTLSALLAERASVADDRPRFIGMFLQIAQTIAYAHAKGVIHRDLKPANVMVGSFGEVQVMDWGLAKVLGEGGVVDEAQASRALQHMENATVIHTARTGSTGFGTDTEAGSLMGTPAYMSPEQANGDVEQLDRRTDVFGLGAILCEMLTGAPPYAGRNAEEVRRKAANGDQAELQIRLDASGAESELIELARLCLAPEPIDRPRDAQAVAESVSDHLNGVQERLRRAELDRAATEVRAIEERKRRRVQLGLAASVLVLLGLAAGTGLWIQRNRTESAARESALERDITAALREATIFESQNKFAEARAAVSRAEGLLAGGGAIHAERVATARADLDMLAQLERIRFAQAEVNVKHNTFDSSNARAMFAGAFRNYGIDVLNLEPNVAAALIRARDTRTFLVAALDEWARVVSARDMLRLFEVADLADPNPQGPACQLRQAARSRNRDELLSFAKSDAAARLTPGQTVVLALWLKNGKANGESIELLQRAQAQHPDDFWVNHWLAFALVTTTPSRAKEAIGYYRAALARHAGSAGVYLNLGVALQASGDLTAAASAFRRAIELRPDYGSAHAGLGEALTDLNDLPGAIASTRQAVAIDESNPVFRRLLADALLKNKQFEAAETEARIAIKLDPDIALNYATLAVALESQGKLADAAGSYRRAIELDASVANWINNLGTVIKRQGHLPDAIAEYRRAIQVDPVNRPAHINLAHALESQHKYKEAADVSWNAVGFDPRNSQIWCNLAHQLRMSGNAAASEAAIRRATILAPDNAVAHNNLAVALRDRGKSAESIAECRKVIRLDANNERAHFNLGLALIDLNDMPGAAAAFQKVIELNSTSAKSYRWLSHVLRYQNKLGDALTAVQKAVDLEPNDSWGLELLATDLMENSQFAEALDVLRRGLAVSKGQPRNRYFLDQIKRVENWLVIEPKLQQLIAQETKPAGDLERLDVAELCRIKKYYRAAAQFSAEALQNAPELGNNIGRQHRYLAACHAALAATRPGADNVEMSASEQAVLRRNAIDWLRADLDAWSQVIAGGDAPAIARARTQLRHWWQDSDLAGIRDDAALSRIPPDEQADWRRFWSAAAGLLKKTELP